MQILDDLSTEVRQFLSNLRELPITSAVTPAEVRGFLGERYDFSRPTELGRVFRDVSEMFHRWNEHSNHPRHFGLFVPSIDVSSVVADALEALYNPQLAVWEMSPAGNEIEQHTLSRLAAAFGYDPGRAVHHFTTGGSEANLTAVVAALTDRFPRYGEEGLAREKRPPVLYLSEEGHHSFVKAAHVTGIGRRAVRFVPAGDDLRMDLDALARQVDEDLERGCAPDRAPGPHRRVPAPPARRAGLAAAQRNAAARGVLHASAARVDRDFDGRSRRKGEEGADRLDLENPAARHDAGAAGLDHELPH